MNKDRDLNDEQRVIVALTRPDTYPMLSFKAYGLKEQTFLKSFFCACLLIALFALVVGCTPEKEQSSAKTGNRETGQVNATSKQEQKAAKSELPQVGQVNATLKFVDRNQADNVGCAVEAFSPDGQKDLHFRLTLVPFSVGDIEKIELIRQGFDQGVLTGGWTTGTGYYALGVSKAGSSSMLGVNGTSIPASQFDKEGFDLFACDDGASSDSDTFIVNIASGGKNYSSAPITLSEVN
ncbi:MAG: hypothetical protein ACRER2_07330 [Methylococcales bacterium]